MVQKPKRRSKHIPRRTCVGCREVLPKRALIRVVKTPAGVLIDPTGKMAGRGAYIHDQRSCWQRGLNGALEHALRIRLTDQEKDQLLSFFESLSETTLEDRGAEDSLA